MDKEEVRAEYDRLVGMEVSSPGVQNVLNVLGSHKAEFLKALDYPGVPLHNNASERDIRGMVKIRKVSGGTKSEEGRMLRDGLMTIKQTCLRLGINFWQWITGWFIGKPIDLAARVRARYQGSRTPAISHAQVT